MDGIMKNINETVLHEDIARLCQHHLRRKPVEIIHYPSGGDRVYGLNFGDSQKVIKVGGRGEAGDREPSGDRGTGFAFEVGFAQFLAAHDIPFLPILAYGDTGDFLPNAWMLMEYGGVAMNRYTGTHWPDLLREAGVMLGHIHGVNFGTQGSLNAAGEVTADPDWASRRRWDAQEKVRLLAGCGALDARDAAKIDTLLGEYLPSAEAVLCHLDYTAGQLLVSDDHVRYVLDWPSAMAVNPASDLACMDGQARLWNFDFDVFSQGYEEVRPLGDYGKHRLSHVLVYLLTQTAVPERGTEMPDFFQKAFRSLLQ